MAGDYLNVGDCHVATLLAMTDIKEVRDSNQNRQTILWSDVGREHREKASVE